jgi:hypothetical protein
VIAVLLAMSTGACTGDEGLTNPVDTLPAISGYSVVGTDQDTWYDDRDVIPAPAAGAAFHGQNADYPGTAPSYQDNGDGTVTDLVAALLAGLSGRAVDAADEIRRRVLDIQDQMDRDPGQVVVLERLRLGQSSILELAGIRDFETAVSDAQYLDRAIDRLEKRLANLREELALHQQDRTNRRLAVLTVLSAVFLPLTLIAGIYGMNFEIMPELGYRFAYPLALGSMVVLGLGMIAWFRSRGWFD